MRPEEDSTILQFKLYFSVDDDDDDMILFVSNIDDSRLWSLYIDLHLCHSREAEKDSLNTTLEKLDINIPVSYH